MEKYNAMDTTRATAGSGPKGRRVRS